MSTVYHSTIRNNVVIDQALHRYDKTGNREELINELSSEIFNAAEAGFEDAKQYYEEYWEEKEVENEHLDLRLYDLLDKLPSVRACNGMMNIMHYEKIETVRDLVQMSQQKLLRYKNIGRKTIGEIKVFLADMGLSLNMVMR
tara:strand:- start:213 stop:638 length:426 start_codon:yes stop_codon:yes gene_type:complete